MARIHEQAQTTITMNGQQAAQMMDLLSERAETLKEKLKQAFDAGDVAKQKKYQKELDNTQQTMASMRKEAIDVEKVLKNLNGASLNELSKSAQKVRRELRRMNESDPEYKVKIKQLNDLNDRYKTMSQQINGVTKASKGMLSNLADGFNRYFGVATAFVASFTGVVFGFRNAVDAYNEFEERLDNLSALTGLAGKDLDWLAKRADDLSVSMVEGNIRVKQSATEIVDAFTKTGSARPELLKNREALAAVTEEAIILANASKTALQPAIEALTMVMNQYNVPASEARRIINTIAAGSKEGAGEIPYITAAFEKAGTVASDAGISIETLVATIETLAPRITAPEIAGRTLKGVLLDLQTTADETNPAIVGLVPALENLAKKELSVVELTKLFGTENITTAKILLNNIGELKKYEAAVTGTNVAIEQATTNTGNNAAKLAQARNEMAQARKELGEKLAPAMNFSTNAMSYTIRVILSLIKFFGQYGRTVLVAAASIATYTIAVNASNIAFKAQYYWLLMVEKAQKLLNTTTKMNPYAAVASLLAGMVTYLIMVARRTNEAADAQKRLNDYMKDSEDLMQRSQTIKQRAATIDNMSKAQLERFINDAETELNTFQTMEDKKLLAAKVYQDEVTKLEAYVSRTAQNEAERVALYNNKLVTEGRDNAMANLQEVSNFVDSNTQMITDSIEKAKKLLAEFNNAGGGTTTTGRQGVMPSLTPNPAPTGIDADLSKSLQSAFEQKKLELLRQKAEMLITEEEYNTQLENLEIAHLMTTLEMRRQAGLDTIDVETELLNKRIALQKDFTKEISEQIDEQVEKQIKAAKHILTLSDFASSAIEGYVGGNADALKEGAKQMIGYALDLLKAQTEMAIAGATIQSLLQPDSIATMGASGLVRAAVLIGLIEAAFAGVKGLANSAIDGFESGGYTGSGSNKNVKGVVHANEFVANAGAVNNPTVRPMFDLVNYAQQNGTISSLNLPAAMAASGMMLPGSASRSSVSQNISLDASMMLAAVAEFKAVVKQLQDGGIETHLDYYRLKRMMDKEQKAISKTK